MSTESLAVEQRVVVRFAYSQVVRNGWSKQNCTSYLISHGFNRLACDELYNHIVSNKAECVGKLTEGPNSIIKNLLLPKVQPSTGTVDHSDVMDQFRSEIKQLEDPTEFLRNYSRQYRREAMHNTHLVHLRYFWEGPCESNIPNRLRLGMIERSISSDDGGVDDASDEGYTDGLYPDFPKRWRKKEELAFEGGVQGGFVHEDNIKQKDRPTDVLAITSSGEEDRPNLLMYENRLNENRLFEILNEVFTSFGYASPSPNEPWVYNEDSDDDSLPELSDSFEILNGNDRLLSYASPNPVYCGIVSAHLQVIMNDYPERCANTSLVTGYGYAGYASPNPNEAPVYNEDDSNGDSDDDSLPELS